jgi:hypothetical protein
MEATESNEEEPKRRGDAHSPGLGDAIHLASGLASGITGTAKALGSGVAGVGHAVADVGANATHKSLELASGATHKSFELASDATHKSLELASHAQMNLIENIDSKVLGIKHDQLKGGFHPHWKQPPHAFELFFDLAFAQAFGRACAGLSVDINASHILLKLVTFFTLWFAWVEHMLYSNFTKGSQQESVKVLSKLPFKFLPEL